MKRVLSFVLSVLFVVPVMIMSASAAEASWMWPVVGTTTANISQYYHANHDALDIATGVGATVIASKSGRIIRAYNGCRNFSGFKVKTCTSVGCSPNAGFYDGYCNSGYGNGVVIDHGDGTYSHYAHLNSVAVVWGQQVTQGQPIGTLGSSGMSGGPHLHFALAYSDAGAGSRINSNPANISYLAASVSNWHTSMTPVDLGAEFDARIIKTNGQMTVGAKDYNVQLVADQTDGSDVWHFLRKSDGSYTLRNRYYDVMMDVANADPSSGTNVGLCAEWSEDNSAQRWYIYGTQGSYILRPKLSSCVLDVYDNSNAVGTNVHIWTKNDSTAQFFTILKVTEDSSGEDIPSVPVNPDNMASVVVDTSMSQYSIGSTNAVLSGVVNNPSSRTISTVGLYLYDSTGKQIGKHAEQCNPSYVTHHALKMWFDLNSEAGIALKPGVRYQYALYAYVDGKLYVSNKAYFQTTGYTLGDVDASGEVNASDALLALQGATRKVNLNAQQTSAASVDKSTGVAASDALLILQYATKKITAF